MPVANDSYGEHKNRDEDYAEGFQRLGAPRGQSFGAAGWDDSAHGSILAELEAKDLNRSESCGEAGVSPATAHGDVLLVVMQQAENVVLLQFRTRI